MRKSVGCFCTICGVVGILATGAAAQVPVFDVTVTAVYDSDWNMKCGGGDGICPTQNLPAGIAEEGDYLNLEIRAGGWDDDLATGVCITVTGANTGGTCNIALQDCPLMHCADTGSLCEDEEDCNDGVACVADTCTPWPRLGAYQFIVDSSGYWNGGEYPGLIPADILCSSNEDCWCAYDPECFDSAEQGRCTCSVAVCEELSGICNAEANGYINYGNSEFVFLTAPNIPIVSHLFWDYEYGATIFGGQGVAETEASPYYVGTLVLEATDHACGTFVIDLRQGLDIQDQPIDTFLNDQSGVKYPAPEVLPATINFDAIECDPPCVDPPDACQVNWCDPCDGVCKLRPAIECPEGTVCVDVGGEPVCKPLCNLDNLLRKCSKSGNPCVDDNDCDPGDPADVCHDDTIPPVCAIDARQRRLVDDITETFGWRELVLQFDCDPSPANFRPADFLNCYSLPVGYAPFVETVETDEDAHTVTLGFSKKITADVWSCVVHDESGKEWCLGFLPGDVSQNSRVTAEDLEVLLDVINAGTELPDYATDMNRSGATNAQDILRLIDLLNGAGDFKEWLGEEMGSNPSHGRCPSF